MIKIKNDQRRLCQVCRQRRYIEYFPTINSYACKKHFEIIDINKKYRTRRISLKQNYTKIKNGKSERACAFIDRFHQMESQHYRFVIVSKFFTSKECSEIKQFEENQLNNNFEPINFDNHNQKQVSRRFQKKLFEVNITENIFSQMIPCLAELVNVLIECHPNISNMIGSILKSQDQCPSQRLHADDFEVASIIDKIAFKDMSFSLLVALEPDINPTQILIGEGIIPFTVRTQSLTQGSFILFRGNCPHAGASYTVENKRLFISIGTHKYPHKGTNVALYY